MNPTEHSSKTSRIANGIFAALGGLVHVLGSSAPSNRGSALRVRGRAVRGVAGAVAAMVCVAFYTSPAFAGDGEFKPSFDATPVVKIVHSTRVALSVTLQPNSLPTSWQAEYISAAALEKAEQHKQAPEWILVASGETKQGQALEEVKLGQLGQNEGSDGPYLVRNLEPGTKYYARFVAKNIEDKVGEAAELTIPFETLPIEKPEIGKIGKFEESVTTFAMKGERTDTVAGFSATIDTNGASTEYEFQYSLPENGEQPSASSKSWIPFSTGATGVVTASEDIAVVEARLVDLLPETTYYVRVKAHNEKGEIIQSTSPNSFTQEAPALLITLTAKPGGETPKVRNVTAASAHIRASVEAHGSETDWQLELAGSASGPWAAIPGGSGTISKQEAGSYYDAVEVSAGLSGLSPSKIYYVRLVAINACASVCGETISTSASFETSGAPTVDTSAVHALHGELVRLLGSVDPSSTPTSAEQSIAIEGAPTGGTFTLMFEGQTTEAIAAAATEAGSDEVTGVIYLTGQAIDGEQVSGTGIPPGTTVLREEGPSDETLVLSADAEATASAVVLTANLPYNAASGLVDNALEALSGEPQVTVDGADGGPYTVFFGRNDSGEAVPLIEGDGSGLVPSGSVGSVKVTNVQQGGVAYVTHDHFEYVSQKQFEADGGWGAAVSGPEGDAGTGNSPVSVGEDISGLRAGETYRYRLVASNTAPGTAVVDGVEHTLTVPVPAASELGGSCPNEAFRTGLSAHLPDCRAYEQVTPVQKGGAQEPFTYGFAPEAAALVGEDGGHAVLEASAANYGSGSRSGQSPYFFSRQAGKGWSMIAGDAQPEAGIHQVQPQVYSQDLTQIAFESAYAPSAHSLSPKVEYEIGPAGGPYTTAASVPREDAHADSGWLAADADFSKLVLGSEDRALLGEATGTKSGLDLYEYSTGRGLTQLNVSSENETIGSCGATVAKGYEQGAGYQTGGAPHSVSADGSRVFFYAVPGKSCSAPPDLYMRVNGSETVDIGTYQLLAANVDGTKLLLEKHSGEGYEVLLYETESTTVTGLVSTQSPVARDELDISGEMTAFYFVSSEQLTAEAPAIPAGNLEVLTKDLYRYDVAEKALSFLVQGTSASNGFPLAVSPNGDYMYFGAADVAGLPGGGQYAGDDQPSQQVYRYDSTENVVQCMSCASSFDPEPKLVAQLDGADAQSFVHGGPLPTYVSADGDFALFTTAAALVPQDVDGEIPPTFGEGEYPDSGQVTSPSSDIYEWRKSGIDGCTQLQGCLALITDGRGGYKNLLIGTADEGQDIFIYTRSKLLPQDDDTAGDIYDVRVDGGFAGPVAPATECEGDACSAPPAPPSDATPSSLTFTGNGNVIPPLPSKPAPKAIKPKTKRKTKNKKAKRKKNKNTTTARFKLKAHKGGK